jgi:hypothetical protein
VGKFIISPHWLLSPSLSYDYNNALKIVSFFEAMNILTKITELDIRTLCLQFLLTGILADGIKDI